MIVKVFKKTLHLKKENEKTAEDYINSDELFWNDLYVEASDGWTYLWDIADDKVYMLDGARWNWIDELNTGKTLILHAVPNDPNYEFNREK